MSTVCSVSWYDHHHTYFFTILEQNMLLRQKFIHVSCNTHCLLIFCRHWTCEFAFFFSIFKHTSPQLNVPWLHRNINERNRRNIQSFHMWNYCGFLYFNIPLLVCNKRLLTYLLIPWSRKLLENLTGSKLVNNSPAFLGNQKVHFLNNYNDEILISITVRPSETSYIEYTRMPSPNQHVTNLVVFQSGEFQVHLWKFWCWTSCTF